MQAVSKLINIKIWRPKDGDNNYLDKDVDYADNARKSHGWPRAPRCWLQLAYMFVICLHSLGVQQPYKVTKAVELSSREMCSGVETDCKVSLSERYPKRLKSAPVLFSRDVISRADKAEHV